MDPFELKAAARDVAALVLHRQLPNIHADEHVAVSRDAGSVAHAVLGEVRGDDGEPHHEARHLAGRKRPTERRSSVLAPTAR